MTLKTWNLKKGSLCTHILTLSLSLSLSSTDSFILSLSLLPTHILSLSNPSPIYTNTLVLGTSHTLIYTYRNACKQLHTVYTIPMYTIPISYRYSSSFLMYCRFVSASISIDLTLPMCLLISNLSIKYLKCKCFNEYTLSKSRSTRHHVPPTIVITVELGEWSVM